MASLVFLMLAANPRLQAVMKLSTGTKGKQSLNEDSALNNLEHAGVPGTCKTGPLNKQFGNKKIKTITTSCFGTVTSGHVAVSLYALTNWASAVIIFPAGRVKSS